MQSQYLCRSLSGAQIWRQLICTKGKNITSVLLARLKIERCRLPFTAVRNTFQDSSHPGHPTFQNAFSPRVVAVFSLSKEYERGRGEVKRQAASLIVSYRYKSLLFLLTVSLHYQLLSKNKNTENS